MVNNYSSAHIIFDLSGVLFIKDYVNQNSYLPMNEGIAILQQCYQARDHQGNQRHKLYILSNSTEEKFSYLQKNFPDILNLFNGHVVSAHVGLKKPDIRIFNYFLSEFKVPATTCIFIDDALENIQAAHYVGIHGIEYNDPGKVKNKLVQLGIF